MSEKKAEFDTTLTEDSPIKNGDIICIKGNFLKFAASNEKFGLFLFDKLTAEYKKITGLS
jgi:hypothetical protein